MSVWTIFRASFLKYFPAVEWTDSAKNLSLNRAVCEAACRADLGAVRRLRHDGANLQADDNEPLCQACQKGHLEIVRYLHRNRVNLHARNDEPLCQACQGGHLDVVRYLHEHRIQLNVRNNEPLLRACSGGHLHVVRYLQQNGVNLTAPHNEPLCRAAAAGHLELVEYIHQNGGNIAPPDNEPLCRAAAAGHLDLVRYIHQNGGDISTRNSEPLRRAAAGGHAAVVQYLHNAGAATKMLTIEAAQSLVQMNQEILAAPAIDHPSAFWTAMRNVNHRMLDWSGEANFKRTLNQNYFNFIPSGPQDARMVRMHRLMRHLEQNAHDQYVIEDPDNDPPLWASWYPDYQIFKEPNRAIKRELYREYLALMYEYALQRDHSGLLPMLEEPTLGNPIRVYRNGKLISQDLVNSLRERNSILAAMEGKNDTHFTLAELGAGYGRLGYIMLTTTRCRYFVFDIPPALYLSQWYLTTLFPSRPAFRFRHFDTFREIEGELSHADLAFFTPNQLAKFPTGYFDMFATISSIHEMRREQISHYMTLMGRTARSALYLKQQKNYLNPIDNLIIGQNDYPLPIGWSPWRERFDLINPGFFERIYRRHQPLDLTL